MLLRLHRFLLSSAIILVWTRGFDSRTSQRLHDKRSAAHLAPDRDRRTDDGSHSTLGPRVRRGQTWRDTRRTDPRPQHSNQLWPMTPRDAVQHPKETEDSEARPNTRPHKIMVLSMTEDGALTTSPQAVSAQDKPEGTPPPDHKPQPVISSSLPLRHPSLTLANRLPPTDNMTVNTHRDLEEQSLRSSLLNAQRGYGVSTTPESVKHASKTDEQEAIEKANDHHSYRKLLTKHDKHVEHRGDSYAANDEKASKVKTTSAPNTVVPAQPPSEDVSSPNQHLKNTLDRQMRWRMGGNLETEPALSTALFKTLLGTRLRRRSDADDDNADDKREESDDINTDGRNSADDENGDNDDDDVVWQRGETRNTQLAKADQELEGLLKEDIPVPTIDSDVKSKDEEEDRETEELAHLLASLMLDDSRNELKHGDAELDIVGNRPNPEKAEEREFDRANAIKQRQNATASQRGKGDSSPEKADEESEDRDNESIDVEVDTVDPSDVRRRRNTRHDQNGPSKTDESSRELFSQNSDQATRKDHAGRFQDQDSARHDTVSNDGGRISGENTMDMKRTNLHLSDVDGDRSYGGLQENGASWGIPSDSRNPENNGPNTEEQPARRIPAEEEKGQKREGSYVSLCTLRFIPLTVTADQKRRGANHHQKRHSRERAFMESKITEILKARKERSRRVAPVKVVEDYNDWDNNSDSDGGTHVINAVRQRKENGGVFNEGHATLGVRGARINHENAPEVRHHAEQISSQTPPPIDQKMRSIHFLKCIKVFDGGHTEEDSENQRPSQEDRSKADQTVLPRIKDGIHDTQHEGSDDSKEVKTKELKHNIQNKNITTTHQQNSKAFARARKTDVMMTTRETDQETDHYLRGKMTDNDNPGLPRPVSGPDDTTIHDDQVYTMKENHVTDNLGYLVVNDEANRHTKQDVARTYAQAIDSINKRLENFEINDNDDTNNKPSNDGGFTNADKESYKIIVKTEADELSQYHTMPKVSSKQKFAENALNTRVEPHNNNQKTESNVPQTVRSTTANNQHKTIASEDNRNKEPDQTKIKASTSKRKPDAKFQIPDSISNNVKSKQDTQKVIRKLVVVSDVDQHDDEEKYYTDKQNPEETNDYLTEHRPEQNTNVQHLIHTNHFEMNAQKITSDDGTNSTKDSLHYKLKRDVKSMGRRHKARSVGDEIGSQSDQKNAESEPDYSSVRKAKQKKTYVKKDKVTQTHQHKNHDHKEHAQKSRRIILTKGDYRMLRFILRGIRTQLNNIDKLLKVRKERYVQDNTDTIIDSKTDSGYINRENTRISSNEQAKAIHRGSSVEADDSRYQKKLRYRGDNLQLAQKPKHETFASDSKVKQERNVKHKEKTTSQDDDENVMESELKQNERYETKSEVTKQNSPEDQADSAADKSKPKSKKTLKEKYTKLRNRYNEERDLRDKLRRMQDETVKNDIAISKQDQDAEFFGEPQQRRPQGGKHGPAKLRHVQTTRRRRIHQQPPNEPTPRGPEKADDSELSERDQKPAAEEEAGENQSNVTIIKKKIINVDDDGKEQIMEEDKEIKTTDDNPDSQDSGGGDGNERSDPIRDNKDDYEITEEKEMDIESGNNPYDYDDVGETTNDVDQDNAETVVVDEVQTSEQTENKKVTDDTQE